MKSMRYVWRILGCLSCMIPALLAFSPSDVKAEGVEEAYVRQAIEECRAHWEEAKDRCDRAYIRDFVQDPAGARERLQRCSTEKDNAFDQCADEGRILKSAKFRQFRELNADVLAAMETAQDKSNRTLSAAIEKCLRQRTEAKLQACVKKANAAAKKRLLRIERRFIPRLQPVQ